MKNESKIITKPSLIDLQIKVENLTTVVMAAAQKEDFFQKTMAIKVERIWHELIAFKHTIDAQINTENSMTVEKLADELVLEIGEPDRMHGRYLGAVVGLDRRAWLIQVTNAQAIALPFDEIVESFKPRRGDQIRMEYENCALITSIRVHPANAQADHARLNPNLADWALTT